MDREKMPKITTPRKRYTVIKISDKNTRFFYTPLVSNIPKIFFRINWLPT